MAATKMGMTTKRVGNTPLATPAEEGLALIDGNFRPIAMTTGAETILHTFGGSPDGFNGNNTLSPELLNRLNGRSDSRPPTIAFKAHGRDYTCHVFELIPWTDGIAQPVLALHFKQERSVSETVFQVGEEYHLTDREQEALIGVAMGLSSKELAARMNISPNTVKAFLRLIKIKMGASTRAGVVGKCIDQSGRLTLK